MSITEAVPATSAAMRACASGLTTQSCSPRTTSTGAETLLQSASDQSVELRVVRLRASNT